MDEQFVSSYRTFAFLATDPASLPLAFNCSAGKVSTALEEPSHCSHELAP